MSSEEPLVVKVMRLTRRGSLVSSILDTLMPVEGSSSSELNLNQELVLPNSLLDVYTGESLVFYLFIANESAVTTAFDVSVTAELQATRGDTVKTVTTNPIAQLDAGKYFETSVHLDMPLTPGPVVLIVTLSYLLTRFGDKRILRRTYKLNLVPCVLVSTRVVTLSREEALVEVGICSAIKHNVTITDVQIGNAVDKSPWKPKSLAHIVSATEKSINSRPEIRTITRVHVSNSNSSITVNWLVPSTGCQGTYIASVNAAGEIAKRLSVRLASQLDHQLMFPCSEVFELDLQIDNISDSVEAVDLEFDFLKLRPLLIHGLTEQKIGVLHPGQSIVHKLRIFPAERGIFAINGIRIAGNGDEFRTIGEVLII